MNQDLEAQREYVRCINAGIGFSAHNDYWFYRYGSQHYAVTRPVTKQVILEVTKEDLGVDWMTKLRKRVP